MKKITIFEKIINKKIPARIIYEDEDVISFLDINPKEVGHALVVPKIKSINLMDIDDKTLATLIIKTNKIAKIIIKKLETKGYIIKINNGKKVGQEILYTHMHIIPAKSKQIINEEELTKLLKIVELD